MRARIWLGPLPKKLRDSMAPEPFITAQVTKPALPITPLEAGFQPSTAYSVTVGLPATPLTYGVTDSFSRSPNGSYSYVADCIVNVPLVSTAEATWLKLLEVYVQVMLVY